MGLGELAEKVAGQSWRCLYRRSPVDLLNKHGQMLKEELGESVGGSCG